MNPEIKAKWVAALRSGEYKQGKGALRKKTGEMCCLGVLCALVAPNAWGAPPDYVPNSLTHDGLVDLPGNPVRNAAGFDDNVPWVTINDFHDALWRHNDSGRTFAEIADAIEAQL